METTTRLTTRSFTALAVLTTLTLGFSSGARAQAAAATDPENAVVAAPGAPLPGASDDPNADRGFLLPTAMTQPAGSITYNNYELLLHGITYGITDNVQTSLTVLSPIVKDMPFVGFGAVKARLPVGERLYLSAQGSVGFGSLLGSSDSNQLYTVGAGAFASVCLRQDCSSIASASATYSLAFASSGSGNPAQFVIYGGSVVHRITPHIKLLGEVTSAAGRAGDSGYDNLPGVLVSYGIRFHTRNIASDVGFVRPVGEDTGDFLMGLPFVNVSYRWQ